MAGFVVHGLSLAANILAFMVSDTLWPAAGCLQTGFCLILICSFVPMPKSWGTFAWEARKIFEAHMRISFFLDSQEF